MFLDGGKNTQFCRKLKMFGLSDDMKKFLDYLESDEYYELFKSNRMSIHIETGNLIFDDANSGESIFDFFAAQKDSNNKLLHIEFNLWATKAMFPST